MKVRMELEMDYISPPGMSKRWYEQDYVNCSSHPIFVEEFKDLLNTNRQFEWCTRESKVI